MIRTAILYKLFDVCLDKLFEGILNATFSPIELSGKTFRELVMKLDGVEDFPPCYGWEVGEAIENPADYNNNWGTGTCTFINASVNFVDADGDLFVTATDMFFNLTFIREDAAIKYEQFCKADDDDIGFKKVSRNGHNIEVWLKDWHLDGYYVTPDSIISPHIT